QEPDRAHLRLGHAVSARLRVGLFPRPRPRRRGAAPRHGGRRMSPYVFRLPDIGEGVTEAEITAWYVRPGDVVAEDQPLVDVMTDKATVDMSSPVAGEVVAVHGAVGDMVAVGAPLVEIRQDADAAAVASV